MGACKSCQVGRKTKYIIEEGVNRMEIGRVKRERNYCFECMAKHKGYYVEVPMNMVTTRRMLDFLFIGLVYLSRE